MSEKNLISLLNIDLNKFAKSATVLIEKIAGAGYLIYEPIHLRRIAKAEREVSIKKAYNEIEISDIRQRALYRSIEEDVKHQKNIEDITIKALPFIKENSKPENIEDDWLAKFFARSRLISDEQMQILWARVLAGEANEPGSFSKRTVNFLDSLDKKDADIFQSLCSFGWLLDDEITPLIFDSKASIYQDKGLNFDSLTHLESIGLIKYDGMSTFINKFESNTIIATYKEQPLALKLNKDNSIGVGFVILTEVGRELSRICNAPSVDGFFEYVKENWKKHLS